MVSDSMSTGTGRRVLAKAATFASARGPAIGTIQQTIQMPLAEYETFAAWVETTLNNGTARFTLDVWLGTGFANKVCQFVKPGTQITAQFLPCRRGLDDAANL
jgi:hypothetical protein